MINENISERKSCLSTFRDIYLEVVECLNDVNRDQFMVSRPMFNLLREIFVKSFKTICSHLLFSRDYIKERYYFVLAITAVLLKIANVIMLYGLDNNWQLRHGKRGF
jgi:hypothetical protein